MAARNPWLKGRAGSLPLQGKRSWLTQRPGTHALCRLSEGLGFLYLRKSVNLFPMLKSRLLIGLGGTLALLFLAVTLNTAGKKTDTNVGSPSTMLNRKRHSRMNSFVHPEVPPSGLSCLHSTSLSLQAAHASGLLS